MRIVLFNTETCYGPQDPDAEITTLPFVPKTAEDLDRMLRTDPNIPPTYNGVEWHEPSHEWIILDKDGSVFARIELRPALPDAPRWPF